ncbi:hypothetical protein ACWCYL_18665 [Streptomyces sp. 900105755]
MSVDGDAAQRRAHQSGELVAVGDLGALRDDGPHTGGGVLQGAGVAFVEEVLQQQRAGRRAGRQPGHEQDGESGQDAQSDAGAGQVQAAVEAGEVHRAACCRRV